MHRMTLKALVALALLAPRLAADDKQDAVKKELKALEGIWEWVAVSWGGERKSTEVPREHLTLKGHSWRFSASGWKDIEFGTGTLAIDPTKTPKTMDFRSWGHTSLSLYVLEGDELRICDSQIEHERPTGFPTNEGGKYVVRIYKRLKPEPWTLLLSGETPCRCWVVDLLLGKS